MKKTPRTVAALLGIKNGIFNRKSSLPRHTYVYCRSENIARRFLKDAEKEGFTFGDGIRPTERDTSDLFSIHPDLTLSYTGMAGHLLFKNPGCGNVVRIDYGKYIRGIKDFMTIQEETYL